MYNSIDRRVLLAGFYSGIFIAYIFMFMYSLILGIVASLIFLGLSGILVSIVKLFKLDQDLFVRGFVSGYSIIAGFFGIPQYQLIITKSGLMLKPVGILSLIGNVYLEVIFATVLLFYSALIIGWAFTKLEFSILTGLLLFGGMFFVVLTHELGHALFAFLSFKEIVIFLPYGGYTEVSLASYDKLLFAVLGGPFVTWLEGIILSMYEKTRFFGVLVLNLLLANIIPAPYNDGFLILTLLPYCSPVLQVVAIFSYLIWIISSLYITIVTLK